MRLPLPQSKAGARFRNRSVGFVWQEFGLIEPETALSNVMGNGRLVEDAAPTS